MRAELDALKENKALKDELAKYRDQISSPPGAKGSLSAAASSGEGSSSTASAAPAAASSGAAQKSGKPSAEKPAAADKPTPVAAAEPTAAPAAPSLLAIKKRGSVRAPPSPTPAAAAPAAAAPKKMAAVGPKAAKTLKKTAAPPSPKAQEGKRASLTDEALLEYWGVVAHNTMPLSEVTQPIREAFAALEAEPRCGGGAAGYYAAHGYCRIADTLEGKHGKTDRLARTYRDKEFALLSASAGAGHPTSASDIAYMYQEGIWPCKKDKAECAKWLKKASALKKERKLQRN